MAAKVYEEGVNRGTFPPPLSAGAETEGSELPNGGYTRAILRLENDGRRGPGFFVVDMSQHPAHVLAGPIDDQAEALAELHRYEKQDAAAAAIAALTPEEQEADRAELARKMAAVWADPVAGPKLRELGERDAATQTLLAEAEAEIAADPTACHGTVEGTWLGGGPAGCEYPAGHEGPHGWEGLTPEAPTCWPDRGQFRHQTAERFVARRAVEVSGTVVGQTIVTGRLTM